MTNSFLLKKRPLHALAANGARVSPRVLVTAFAVVAMVGLSGCGRRGSLDVPGAAETSAAPEVTSEAAPEGAPLTASPQRPVAPPEAQPSNGAYSFPLDAII